MGRLTSHCVGKKANSQNQNKRANRIFARRLSVLVSATAVSFLTLKGHAQTTNLTWDPAQNANNSLPASGGSGTWNTTLANWSNGTADVVWADTTGSLDNAVFGGTAGTVTLNTSLGTSDLIFQTSGYTISGTGILEMSNNGATDLDSSALTSSGTETLSAIDVHAGSVTWNIGAASLNFAGAVRDNGQSHMTLTVNGTGTALFSGGLTLSQSNSSRTWVLAGGENLDVTGLIQDGGTNVTNGFVYDGTGTLTLADTSNSFVVGSGQSVTVASGVMAIANPGALGGASGSPNPMEIGNNTAEATFQGIGTVLVSIPNAVTLGGGTVGVSVIGGTTPLNFTGAVTGSGSVDDLNVNNTALTTFSGNFYLGSSGSRTVNIGGTGNLLISAPVGDTPTGPGPCSLNYVGTRTLTLNNATNSFTGSLGVDSGTLFLAPGAIGAATQFNFGNNTASATLLPDGGDLNIAVPTSLNVSQTTGADIVAGSNNVNFSGTVTGAQAHVQFQNNSTGLTTFSGPVYLSPNTTNGETVNFGGSGNILISGQISDANGATGANPGSVVFNGTGTVTVSNSNLYTGTTQISSGEVVVASSNATGDNPSSTVTLSGGILASSAGSYFTLANTVAAGSGAHTIVPGGVDGVGTLGVAGLITNSNTTLEFQLGTGSGTITNGSQLILTGGAGSATIGTGTNLEFTGSTAAGNDYELIGDTSGGTVVSGLPLGNFTLPAAPAGETYSLADVGNFIDLVVASSGPVSLFWDNAGGSGNGTTWDTSNQNWNNGSAATTYADGAAVTFNDTNALHYAVTLTTTVSPASVTVNSSGNYSITGGGLIVATGGFTKMGTSTLTLGVGLTASSLAINGGNVVLASNTTASSGWTATNPVSNINVSSLTIAANSVLDISNNHVIIDYGATDPMSTILGYLKSGFNNGAWNGTSGIISSAAQTKTNGLTYSIGWADGNDKTGAVKNLTSGEIELKYTLVGDANLDGTVNGSDFSILAANFGLGVTNWDQGNFLYGSSVNGSDFSALAANFGQGDSGAAVTPADIAALDAFAAANGLPAPTIAAVPEPATLGLLAIGSLGLMSRRRKRETLN